MSLLTVFARREPTVDQVALTHGCADKKDTVFYRDAQCTDVIARKPWYQSGHPRKNSKAVTLNCFRWKLQWAH
ncbi:hypothetical protein WJ97_13085 [Burkholderia ubonensis]|uniref:hypothetical protein n=1 Tax=Burkholderia ubonensis TaxID=101571 RepID=UPI000753D82C|nr:hypothetical protein [Burkholderia ubonensis]KVP96808.1 hypothetical protein WJ97_13085 [Burkholderia ubonensis]